ncbi:MAG: 16S rRNA (guanine(527)-N(7))-methyltransferase RsmG [Alphaproteobacteria bacterium]|nr:16S rRNA (guanine(527)-N(7))-methyltransferase RsmG [Alphaproteobacteria bacterium]
MNNKDKFEQYTLLLKKWSQTMNLVAPSTLSDIQNRHFDDSAQLATHIPKDKNIIDLGSGAGFPGVVLAILGYKVVCIESKNKKTNFLNVVKQELALQNLTIINDRIENFISKTPVNTDTTVFTARAFAPLVKILDYTAKTKCQLFLLKGRNIPEEITLAQTKYKFNYTLTPSKTGDGFILHIKDI